ncbi:MAG: galactose mutarotase [Planctomycetota bacterium]|nr:MAG: galactose mutarotase [Planctomycetota bacterium]
MGITSAALFPVDRRPVVEFQVVNDGGFRVDILNLGGVVRRVFAADRKGRRGNVTLGFADPRRYANPGPYFGAICGRYANRIAFGRFSLDGTEYRLATNDGPHHLHGGLRGFDKVLWDARPFEDAERLGVELSYVSADGEEGYPGTLQVRVRYTVPRKADVLRIDYEAECDRPTVLNLTNHAYWNLAGVDGSRDDVLDHQLTLGAERFVAVDETLIPTGTLPEVDGTPLDFRRPREIGERIDETGGGYDHCFVVDGAPGQLRDAAVVFHPGTGRRMTVRTTEPGVQLYTGNHLDGSESCGGFGRFGGFCLECQHFPDSPNRPEFPSTVLRPGETYRQTTVYEFDAAL